MKILAPVGNMESLKTAIHNGADEVYLGVGGFNARNNIDGFGLESLKDAVDYAHIFGVKVNLAINILFKNKELQQALNTLVDAYNMGVDSFIIQDLGLASLVRNNYPEIELHASTQMGIHNLAGAKWAEDFGFKRIVLARETPLEEIKKIKDNTNLEIEYFAQGALCVSFSGNCYLSSKLFDASGNRGKCKQLCRLPYTLTKNGKPLKTGYLLSAKDFMMIDRLQDLKDAGVDVLKIEGRARRPYYVGVATREYKNALSGRKPNKENIALAFNRDYVAGYFNGNAGVISRYYSHVGVAVGEVTKMNLGKKFNEVFFTSNRKLSPKSTFKFFDGDNEKTTLTAYDLKELQKGRYVLTTTSKVAVGDKVRLIIDQRAEDEMLQEFDKRAMEISVCAKVGEEIRASFQIGGNTFEVCGEDKLESASRQPLTPVEIESNFKKSDLFEGVINIECLGRVFISKQRLNEFRRRVFEKIYDELTGSYERNVKRVQVKCNYTAKKLQDLQFVEKADEKLAAHNIIYSPERYDEEDTIKINDRCKMEGRQLFLDLPNFALDQDVEYLKNLVSRTGVAIVVNNYYALGFSGEKLAGAGLNVYNNFSASVLDIPVMTVEGEVGTSVNFPYMTLRHCPMKANLNASCKNCPYGDGFEYVMENGTKLKLKRKKISDCTFSLMK